MSFFSYNLVVNFMSLKLILKGFIVGIGKIIPGVSGSLLACTLGIYEDLIAAVTNFFGDIKNHTRVLLNVGLGVFLAIIFFSKLILFLLNNYYEPTMYLFLGLIVGTLLPFTKNLKWNLKNFLIFIIFLSLTFILSFKTTNINYIFRGNILDYMYISLLGMIDAFTSIVPGISGTAIFMLLGSYEFVLKILSNAFSFYFIIYGMGMILGIVVVCYIMNYLLKHKREETNIIIFAFMIGSLSIILMGIKNFFNVFMLLMFIIGMIIGFIFDK